MPEITIRSLAEFATKSINDQMRILAEQKRPNAGAAQFKVHYYQSARAAIYQYFKSNHDTSRIAHAVSKINASATMAQHKKDHNKRALAVFLKWTSFRGRNLVPRGSKLVKQTRHSVDVRHFADLTALDGSRTKYLLFNYASNPFDPDIARRTVELAYWLFTVAGKSVSSSDFEFVDLAGSAITVGKGQPRKNVIRNADQNLKVINHLWPII